MKFLTLCIGFFVIPFFCKGDGVLPCDTVLVLKHKNKEHYKYIAIGKNVHYSTHLQSSKKKSKIIGLSDSSFFTELGEVYFVDLKSISAKTTGAKIIDASGKVVLVSGTLISGLGAYLIYYGQNYIHPDNDACGTAVGAIVFVTVGVIAVVVGIPVIILGAIPLLLTGKNYDLEKKWNISTTVIERKQRKTSKND